MNTDDHNYFKQPFNCTTATLQTYNCDKCDFETDLQILLKQHVELCYQNGEKTDPIPEFLITYKCEFCDFKSNSEFLFLRHEYRTHFKPENIVAEPKVEKNESSFKTRSGSITATSPEEKVTVFRWPPCSYNGYHNRRPKIRRKKRISQRWKRKKNLEPFCIAQVEREVNRQKGIIEERRFGHVTADNEIITPKDHIVSRKKTKLDTITQEICKIGKVWTVKENEDETAIHYKRKRNTTFENTSSKHPKVIDDAVVKISEDLSMNEEAFSIKQEIDENTIETTIQEIGIKGKNVTKSDFLKHKTKFMCSKCGYTVRKFRDLQQHCLKEVCFDSPKDVYKNKKSVKKVDTKRSKKNKTKKLVTNTERTSHNNVKDTTKTLKTIYSALDKKCDIAPNCDKLKRKPRIIRKKNNEKLKPDSSHKKINKLKDERIVCKYGKTLMINIDKNVSDIVETCKLVNSDAKERINSEKVADITSEDLMKIHENMKKGQNSDSTVQSLNTKTWKTLREESYEEISEVDNNKKCGITPKCDKPKSKRGRSRKTSSCNIKLKRKPQKKSNEEDVIYDGGRIIGSYQVDDGKTLMINTDKNVSDIEETYKLVNSDEKERIISEKVADITSEDLGKMHENTKKGQNSDITKILRKESYEEISEADNNKKCGIAPNCDKPKNKRGRPRKTSSCNIKLKRKPQKKSNEEDVIYDGGRIIGSYQVDDGKTLVIKTDKDLSDMRETCKVFNSESSTVKIHENMKKGQTGDIITGMEAIQPDSSHKKNSELRDVRIERLDDVEDITSNDLSSDYDNENLPVEIIGDGSNNETANRKNNNEEMCGKINVISNQLIWSPRDVICGRKVIDNNQISDEKTPVMNTDERETCKVVNSDAREKNNCEDVANITSTNCNKETFDIENLPVDIISDGSNFWNSETVNSENTTVKIKSNDITTSTNSLVLCRTTIQTEYFLLNPSTSPTRANRNNLNISTVVPSNIFVALHNSATNLKNILPKPAPPNIVSNILAKTYNANTANLKNPVIIRQVSPPNFESEKRRVDNFSVISEKTPNPEEWLDASKNEDNDITKISRKESYEEISEADNNKECVVAPNCDKPIRKRGRPRKTSSYTCNIKLKPQKKNYEEMQPDSNHKRPIIIRQVSPPNFDSEKRRVDNFSVISEKTPEELLDASKNEENKQSDSFKCLHCSYKCPDVSHLLKHMHDTHVVPDLLSRHLEKDQIEMEVTAENVSDFIKSCRKGDSDFFKCVKCFFESRTLVDLRNHYIEAHFYGQIEYSCADKWYTCVRCKWKTKDVFILRDHLRDIQIARRRFLPKVNQVENENIKSKSTVDLTLGNDVVLIPNEYFTIGEKLFKCKRCNFQGTSTNQMENHFYVRSSTQNVSCVQIQWHKCEHCPYKCRTIVTLVYHMRSEHGEFTTNYMTRSQLLKHLSEDEKYDKSITAQDLDHYRKSCAKTQTGFFQCTICNDKLRNLNAIQRHFFSHFFGILTIKNKIRAKTKWYCCLRCSYKSKYIEDLMSHLQEVISARNKINNRAETGGDQEVKTSDEDEEDTTIGEKH
ncbi:uncharacterized protein LOC123012376 isoform X1 [Tribolium madens]|uniref:uncharacterized protein LOC123012376 isoform X1 n=1 Tax=Tribolium madens TaxID=41895 RepID=UPI001CF7530E|nr:uncharacterized protein LOC123012376 isoform X1 [Tribolium madens]